MTTASDVGEPTPVDEGHWVGHHAITQPTKSAVVMSGSGRELTYAELDARSRRFADVLATWGCRPDDHIALLMQNCPEFLEVCWAGHRSGLHYTPINKQLTTDEITHIVNDCQARVVVVSASLTGLAASVRVRCPEVDRWVVVDGRDGVDDSEPHDAHSHDMVSYHHVLHDAEVTTTAELTEGAAMLYSSGTTGRPKGVKRPRRNAPPGSTLFGVAPSQAPAFGLFPGSVSLVPSPLYHSAGLTRAMMTLSIGATVVVMERFDAREALRAIERHRVTLGMWVPTMLQRLLRVDSADRLAHDISSMTSATVGAGPCPAEVKDAIIEWWGPIVTEMYGGTEGNGLTAITAQDWLAHRGSVGRPVFGQIHIVREDGSPADPGEAGEIWFSDGRPFEYHRDADKTAAAYDAEGRSTLGDIGYLDEEGYLYLTDRKADVIISGAVNIYPREVEEVLLRSPDVADVGVIGVPNEEFGEEVKAIVELRAGVDPVGAEQRLDAHCRASLAGFKCPRSYTFETLPRQETGKLFKRLLRDRYWAGRDSRIV